MKVGIEGTPFFGNLTGVGQYSANLIGAMSDIDKQTQLEVVRQWWFFRKFTPPLPSKNITYRLVKWMPPIFYYQLYKRLGWAPQYDLVALRKYDAFLFFNFVSFPVTKRTKSLAVIYDLSYVLHPQYTSPKNRDYLQKFVPKTLRNADHIITISENSKKEIINYYHIPESRITIINPAVDHKLFRPQTGKKVATILNKYKITGPYILSVCTLEPRKNLIGVLKAFELLPEVTKKQYTLVLVGGKGWLDGELEIVYEKLSQKYNIIKTGYVPDKDLPFIYSGASLFVYPAFYEGFGMPPLEAMACGVPVITSNNSSLPEVVGEAAITLEAKDTERLAKEMTRVLTDKKLADKMILKGLAQANKFDWGKSAKKLLSLLEKVTT